MCVPPDFGPLKDLNDARDTEDERYDNLPDKCPRCSQELNDAVQKCSNCGMKFGPKEKEKNSKIAAFTSLIFPGLGQLYNDQVGKSIIFFILGILFVSYIYYYIIGSVVFLPMIFIFLFWGYNIYDAFSTARKTIKA